AYNQGGRAIFAEIYDPATGALSPAIPVNTSAAAAMAAPKVAATADGGFVVTWTEDFGPDPDPNFFSLHERRFDPYANPFGDDFVANTLVDGSQFSPIVGVSGTTVLTVWTDSVARPGDSSSNNIQAQAAKAPVFDYDSAAFGDFDNNGRSDLLFQN